MRLVQMGLWKPVSLTFYNKARIDDLFVKQTEITKEVAKLDNQIEIVSVNKEPLQAKVVLEYGLRDTQPVEQSFDVELKSGLNNINIPLEINNPKLWMPVNWGEQHLYDFTVKVIANNHVIAEKTERTGLRSVRLVQEEDEHGRSFYFEVNGLPIFAKGANYIPGEIMTTQQDKAFYKRLYDNMEAANFNFERIWGGGIYELEDFYREADERGILVWLDYIFGCTV